MAAPPRRPLTTSVPAAVQKALAVTTAPKTVVAATPVVTKVTVVQATPVAAVQAVIPTATTPKSALPVSVVSAAPQVATLITPTVTVVQASPTPVVVAVTPAPVPATSASAPVSTVRQIVPANVATLIPNLIQLVGQGTQPTSVSGTGPAYVPPPEDPPAPASTPALEPAGPAERPSLPPPAPESGVGERPPQPPAEQAPAPVQAPYVEPPLEVFHGDAFDIGFDAVHVGKGNYASSSIYVSRALEVKDLAQLGLRVVEKRPASESITTRAEMTTATYDDMDDSQFFHGSIEYWVAVRNVRLPKVTSLSSNKPQAASSSTPRTPPAAPRAAPNATSTRTGSTSSSTRTISTTSSSSTPLVVSTTKFPILPTGVTRVNHERLLLSDRSAPNLFLPDTGILMFYADPDTADIKVYRNGLAISSSEWSNLTSTEAMTPNSGVPMRTKLKIKLPLTGDIYTVSYTPSLSTSTGIPDTLSAYSPEGLSVVDLVGDLSARLMENQIVLYHSKDTDIDKSLVYLIIVLRNNTGDATLTPAVEEYTLLVGARDKVKYSEDSF